ncbi:putative transposase [Mycobacteroides abscessus subsp. abscessus]|nr:putative transposase [Mycobacteroides abscessus subsp. abscessus]
MGHPTRLHIAVPRYVCANPDCATTIFRADISTMVAPRAQVTRRTTTWILRSMICDKMSVSAAAAAVGLSWNTLLAGRLRGLARESTALRSLALDDASATWAVRIARGEASALGKIQFTSNTRGTSLKLDGVGLAVHEALLPDLVAKYQKVAKSKKEAVRIAVSRAVGWPVTHKVTLPEQATTTEDGGVLTIITPSLVELTISVDENEFLSRLGALTGRGKRIALAAFDLRKK